MFVLFYTPAEKKVTLALAEWQAISCRRNTYAEIDLLRCAIRCVSSVCD